MHSAEGASGLRMRDRSALEMKSATSSSAASRSGSSCSRVLDLESGCLMTRRAADLALSRAVVAPGGASWNGRAVAAPGGASWNASVANANMQHRAARSEPGEPIKSGLVFGFSFVASCGGAFSWYFWVWERRERVRNRVHGAYAQSCIPPARARARTRTRAHAHTHAHTCSHVCSLLLPCLALLPYLCHSTPFVLLGPVLVNTPPRAVSVKRNSRRVVQAVADVTLR